jgi:putative toxin-antitoxin system antitoxin component (TIGR02293 family)
MKPTFIGAGAKKAPFGAAKKSRYSVYSKGAAKVYSKHVRGLVLLHVDTALGHPPARDVPVSVQVKFIQAGLRESELTDLQTSLDLSSEGVLSLVGLSKATFHRKKTTGANLSPWVSDRVVRFATLLSKAITVFGSQGEANKWLKSPQFGLGGALPLDFAKSEVGAREVENLLGRIEYGVYT